MPHLTVEYSANVCESHFSELFQNCHIFLVNHLPTQLKDCKSRAIQYPIYYLGDGSPQNAFVHACLQVMPGRTTATLQKVAQGLMEIFKQYFSESLKKLHLQITLEIKELHSPYEKFQR